MSGKKQHYIPQSLLRGFLSANKPKSEYAYVFSREKDRLFLPILGIASENYFYSHLSKGTQKTLDDKITDHENDNLDQQLKYLRSLSAIDAVDPKIAAEVVSHLTPRTAHLRTILTYGFEKIVYSAASIFSNPFLAEMLIGLDQDEPSEVFVEQFNKTVIGSNLDTIIGIPKHVLQRIAFVYAKENFAANYNNFASQLVESLDSAAVDAKSISKEHHNKFLEISMIDEVRFEHYASLNWSIGEFGSINVILPDCVAISIDAEGHAHPAMTSSLSETVAIVMPLTSGSILFGHKDKFVEPPVSEILANLARCSASFFVSANDSSETQALTAVIGERSTKFLDSATAAAIQSFLDKKRATPKGTGSSDADLRNSRDHSENAYIERHAEEPVRFNYEISFIGIDDNDFVTNMTDSVREIVYVVHRVLPIDRLDGITITTDYLGALQDLDRGFNTSGSLKTVDRKLGLGIAQAPTVLREGKVKSRVVVDAAALAALADADAVDVEISVHLLVGMLAEVGLMGLIDDTLPEVLLRPFDSEIDSFLYQRVDAALSGYFSARFSSGFEGGKETIAGYCELMLKTMDRIEVAIPEARLSYRVDGELDNFLDYAFENIHHFLTFSARVIGHCDGQGISVTDISIDVQVRLTKLGLYEWFKMFQNDLRNFWERQGRWDSFNEFLKFNRHVERLAWQCGIIPWQAEDGRVWVEVPLGTDFEALSKLQMGSKMPPLATS